MLTHNQFQLGPLTLHVCYDQVAIYSCKVTMGEPDMNVEVEQSVGGHLQAQIKQQITAYLEHRRASFDLPLVLTGSRFQGQVWAQLEQIPAGQTLTYGQLARRLQTAAQPVGGACKRNPIAFFVPCHRVVAATAIGGYAGAWGEGPTIDVKRWLLNHEQGFNCAPD